MTDDKMKFTREAIEAIRSRLEETKQTSGRTWKALANDIGVGESTLNLFMTRKYGENGAPGDLQKLVDNIAIWFRTQDEQRELFASGLMSPGFQQTPTAVDIWALLSYAQMGYMATLVGEPGLGKTMALKRYLETRQNVHMVTASPSRAGYNAFMKALLEKMGGSSHGRSGSELADRVRGVLGRGSGRLLIVDESQHLGLKVIEELRAIHDDVECGVVFTGNKETARAVEGNRTANFAQISSRIAKRVVLDLPKPGDIKVILESWDVLNPDEGKFLASIAMVPGGGALRQMTKVLQLATLMARHHRRLRNLDDLKAAHFDLSAGMAA